jgi:hypothetical protein
VTKKQTSAQKSGLDKIPPFVTRPLWKDRFFWIGLATALFWVLLLWWLFF